ncbi:MAG: hypothetical protein ACKO3W_06400, partial [bacterium]
MLGMKKRAVHARITSAGLPEEIGRFVAEIVRRTRLRRDEQLDVASELLSHFAEGLAAGKSASDLMAAYGDPRISARSLRQSAIAKRGALDRAIGSCIRWSSLATAAVVTLYLGYATVLSFREPVITFDAVAAVNARMPKPGAEGAAIDLYVAKLSNEEGRCIFLDSESAEPQSSFGAARLRVEDDLSRLTFDEAALVRIRADLTQLAPQIESLRKAKDHPVLGVGVATGAWEDERVAKFFFVDPIELSPEASQFSGTLLSALLPQCSMLRSTAKLMCADAALAIHDGRTNDFMDDIEAASMMAAHSGEVGFLINVLVEGGIRQLVLGTIVSAIENHAESFSDAQLARLEQLARVGDLDLTRGFEAERTGVIDLIQRCYSDNGDGDGVLLAHSFADFMREVAPMTLSARDENLEQAAMQTSAFLSGPIAATALPSRREVLAHLNAFIDAHMEAAKSPSRKESIALAAAVDRDFDIRRDATGPMLSLMMPAIGRTVSVMWALRATQDTTAAAIGIERFRRANGRFPADRAELEKFVGWRLDANGHEQLPWNYALVDGRPMIYDAGVDGFDDRARTPLADEPEQLDANGLPIRDENRRLVSLTGASADRAASIGTASAKTLRNASSVAADTPLDPTQPLVDLDVKALSSEGDHIRVLWKSGAAGWARGIPARIKASSA